MAKIIALRILGGLTLLIGGVLVLWFVYNQIWPTDEFKRGFRSVFQLAFPIFFLVYGWKWVRYEGEGIEEITPPDLKCSELEDAIVLARNSLPEFLREVDKGIDGAYIKFPLKTPKGLTEHIWGYVHSFRDGQFNVSLVNDPFDEEQKTDGRRNVPQEEVEDWQIMLPDGRIMGAFSLIAIFRYHQGQGIKLSPKMKKQKDQLISAADGNEGRGKG